MASTVDVVDLVSPDVVRRGQLSRGSFGSCISETPSPEAGSEACGKKGDETVETGKSVSGRHASPHGNGTCPITGLPINGKLISKLQSSSQVTAATLRRVLLNVLGLPYEDVRDNACRDTLILKYHNALKDRTGRKPESGCSSLPGTHRPAESRESPQPLANSLECRIIPSTLRNDIEKGFSAAKAETMGGSHPNFAGSYVQETGGLWSRLERKRHRLDCAGKEHEDVDPDMPLWHRLEKRRMRGLLQDSSGGCVDRAADDSDDNDMDIFAASARSSTPKCRGNGPAMKASIEHRSAGSDSDQSVSDLTCLSHRAAASSAPLAADPADVASLMRERDEEVRRQTAAAVEALDFDRAAAVKRIVHANFEDRIAAAKKCSQNKVPGHSSSAGKWELGGRPAGGEASGFKSRGRGGRASRGTSRHGAPRMGKQTGASNSLDAENGQKTDEKNMLEPDYSAMSVGELRKMMSRYGLKSGAKAYMVEKLSNIWRELHAPAAAQGASNSPRRRPSGDNGGQGDDLRRSSWGVSEGVGPRHGAAKGRSTCANGGRGKGPQDQDGSVVDGVCRAGGEGLAQADAGCRKSSKDAQALSAAAACLATHPIMDRILMCQSVSFSDVSAVLGLGGVKLSKRLLSHLLDQQGITHHSSAEPDAPSTANSANASAAEDEEPRARRARGRRGARGGSRGQKPGFRHRR